MRRDDLEQYVTMKGLTVRAVPYDMPIIGYGRQSIGTLRLWQCEAVEDFDFDAFNAQDYAAACRSKNRAEDITKVLYPNDTMKAGKLMRLRQQYVLVSASLQDMLDAYRRAHGDDLSGFAKLHAVQLNDTHPTMAIPELVRLLMNEGMTFGRAFNIARRTFRYTNHTVMREALECWDLKLMSELSPELVRVIRRIQTKLNADLKKAGVEDAAPYAIIDAGKRVHMANLAVYGSSYTNGVAEEWYALYPERFNNKTNGITQRRWLGLCNPELTALLADALGTDAFLTDLFALKALKPLIDDDLAARFIEVKDEKKRQLSELILEREGIDIPPHFVFDVQVKRLHEYKRQLMNALSILDIYYGLKDGSLTDFPPTAFIFGAKSAPGYARAKAVIRFINRIAAMVNADMETNDRLRVAFLLRRAHHPGGGHLRADLPRGHRGQRHRQHEADAERRGDAGHLRRREHRDRGAGRRGQQLRVRRDGGGIERRQGQLRPAGHLRGQPEAETRDRRAGRIRGGRSALPRGRPGGAEAVAARRRQLARARPLLRAQGLRLLHGSEAAGHPRHGRPDRVREDVPLQHRRGRQVLQRPDDCGVLGGDLEEVRDIQRRAVGPRPAALSRRPH